MSRPVKSVTILLRREPGAETITSPFLRPSNSCMQGLGMRSACNTAVDINVVGGKRQYNPWVFGRGYKCFSKENWYQLSQELPLKHSSGAYHESRKKSVNMFPSTLYWPQGMGIL